jgi:hypothetical protein
MVSGRRRKKPPPQPPSLVGLHRYAEASEALKKANELGPLLAQEGAVSDGTEKQAIHKQKRVFPVRKQKTSTFLRNTPKSLRPRKKEQQKVSSQLRRSLNMSLAASCIGLLILAALILFSVRHVGTLLGSGIPTPIVTPTSVSTSPPVPTPTPTPDKMMKYQQLYDSYTKGKTATVVYSFLSHIGVNTQWEQTPYSNKTCSFNPPPYHLVSFQPGHSFFCYGDSKASFSNFIYTTQETVVHGDGSIIFFRANAEFQNFFRFEVHINGTYTDFRGSVTGPSVKEHGLLPHMLTPYAISVCLIQHLTWSMIKETALLSPARSEKPAGACLHTDTKRLASTCPMMHLTAESKHCSMRTGLSSLSTSIRGPYTDTRLTGCS